MPNPICHWELIVGNTAKAKAFYAKVFDWKFAEQPGGEYTLIDAGTPPGGGLMAKPPAAPGPALNVYFQVDAIDATLRAVVEAGGHVIVPRTEVPGMGSFAMFQDPDRIAVGVFEVNR